MPSQAPDPFIMEFPNGVTPEELDTWLDEAVAGYAPHVQGPPPDEDTPEPS